jgi:N6-L-threonylcarbamoyladenine synthase
MIEATFLEMASPGCAVFHRGLHPFLQCKYTLYRSCYSSMKNFCSAPSLNKQVSPCLSSPRSNRGIIEPCREWAKDGKTIPNDELVILGIETSCDDTGAAVVTGDGKILSQVIRSQVVEEALQNANLTPFDLSAVAVTIGPGLSLCLRVGVRKARILAGKHNLPMVGIHHMEAHALVARLTEKELQFPFLALLISGGHNLLILAQSVGQYVQLGTTIDDAIGEAYDKTARWLGLDMRRGGGPALEELAQEGNPYAIKLSVPMQQHKDCNFSYAGLKTQVRKAIESKNIDANKDPIVAAITEDRKLRADIAASFQRVAVLHLEQRCDRAVEWAKNIEPSINCLVVSGGVASNHYVRMQLAKIVRKHNLKLVCPPPSLCTDNGVMVAWTGIEHFRLGRWEPPPAVEEPEDGWLDLRPRWQLGEIFAEGRSSSPSLRRARIHPSLTSSIQMSLQNNS